MRVRALARPGSERANLEGLDVEVVLGDLTRPESYARALNGCRWAFHAAADYRLWIPDPDAMYRANVDGSVALVEAAVKAGVERVVYTSSVATLKPGAGTPGTEQDFYPSEDGIIGHYKRSKWRAEEALLGLARAGAPVVVVNPAAPIGPRDIKPTPTGKIVLDFLEGRIPAYLDTGLNVVHVDDCAQGHLLALKKGRVGERYILGGDDLTFKRILDLLAAITGRPAPSLKLPHGVALAAAALETAAARALGFTPRAPYDAVRMAKYKMFFSSAKAERELGYTHRPAREALADAVAYFQGKAVAR